ncbi:hypothetical protein MVES_002699 [Malassezia vespertilionis]|uniref:L-2-hydroxyglutarate dehydrogenase, mitochondrial n=2 Tax=Malassezia vespertilionis TaxID=2020962 RepID=A0A2N1JA33_9BASI|nr:hypothetical protein MVES_002699 [Malassezia vespertilionis]
MQPWRAPLNAYGRYAYRAPDVAVDHLIIGAGAVGLAIANALARRWPDKTTYIVERHATFGQETSSRNSEVIHAGLYYPRDSLKTRFCLEGRELLYKRAAQHDIPVKQVGKLVVGTAADRDYLASLKAHCDALGLHMPTELLDARAAHHLAPDLADEIECALFSPRTGIVESHALMASFAAELDTLPSGESPEAELVYGTSVVRVDPYEGAASGVQGWVVQTHTSGAAEHDTDALLCKVLINASGLNAPRILNTFLHDARIPEADWINMYFAKGNYASYRGPGVGHVQQLLYPIPSQAAAHAHQSLGTHLTLDMHGSVRFGPDVEWLAPPEGGSEDEFWASALAPRADDAWFDAMHHAIRQFLPGVARDGLAPDYCGIRPKLVGPDARTFVDFQLLWHASTGLGGQRLWQYALPDAPGAGAMLSLLGIESPGLTSSLAIAEHVAEQLAQRVWGAKNPSGKARK